MDTVARGPVTRTGRSVRRVSRVVAAGSSCRWVRSRRRSSSSPDSPSGFASLALTPMYRRSTTTPRPPSGTSDGTITGAIRNAKETSHEAVEWASHRVCCLGGSSVSDPPEWIAEGGRSGAAAGQHLPHAGDGDRNTGRSGIGEEHPGGDEHGPALDQQRGGRIAVSYTCAIASACRGGCVPEHRLR